MSTEMEPVPDRESGGKWRRGSSGNPGGKTKAERNVLREVREAAASYAPEALKTLVNIMRNRRIAPATRIAAVSALLDRAVGKPSLSPTFADGSPLPVIDVDEISALEKARRIAHLLAKGMRVIEHTPVNPPSGETPSE